MKRVVVMIVVLAAVWGALFMASHMALTRAANTVYDGCFDNAGKWYSR